MLILQRYSSVYVSDIQKIKNLASHLCNIAASGNSIIVVVPEITEITQEWLRLANQISNKPCIRERNMILATGRQISISLLTMALQELGQSAISLTEAQIGITSDLEHEYIVNLDVQVERIKKYLNNRSIVVIANPQHINEDTSNFNDTFLVSLASHLKVDSCEIYKNQDGYFTAQRLG